MLTAMQPCALSKNLENFQKMLETAEIARNQEFVDLNQTSLRDLNHFLKTYTNGLRVEQPLGHELHRLQFVVPYASSLHEFGCSRGLASYRAACVV